MSKELAVADFQTTLEGKDTDLFFLENRHGVRAAVTNYGARIVAIWMPDRSGDLDNVVAGYDSIAGYLNHEETYLGAMIGRYANRIKNATFKLNGDVYDLTANEDQHHLHGGKTGFHNVVWDANLLDRNCLNLRLKSPDGHEGFPGNVEVEVVYTFNDKDELLIETKAISDKDTVLNITNHSYFNLGGEDSSITARSHRLMIDADHYLPINEKKIPLKPKPVGDTPFDFRKFQDIGEQLDISDKQIQIAEGYDHNFILNRTAEDTSSMAARIVEPNSGRTLEITTTEPGLQFFECEFPKALELNPSTALCLEPQHFPDSPNRPDFPSTVLKAGEQFYSKSRYCFYIDNK